VTPLGRADKLRIAFAPLYVLVGVKLVWQWVVGVRGSIDSGIRLGTASTEATRLAPLVAAGTARGTIMILWLGLAFIAFGIYRMILIRRALKERR
jgi:hypothetical protein